MAVSAGGPVGIDVEQAVPLDFAQLRRQLLAEGEELRSLADFYRSWTRKESVLKATGDGLRVAMTDIRVTPPHQPPALLGYAGRAGLVAAMADLEPGPGYAAALTVLAAPELRVRQHDAGDLLTRRH